MFQLLNSLLCFRYWKQVGYSVLALCLIGFGYYLAKPKNVVFDPAIMKKVELLEADKKAAIADSEKSKALANEIQSQRLSLEADRARQRAENERLKAKLAEQTAEEPDSDKPEDVAEQTKDLLIEKQGKYISGLEGDVSLLKSENALLRKSNESLENAVKLGDSKFDAYKVGKETQIAAMKTESWKSNAKWFFAGVVADRAVTIAFRLRF